ncbi:MAG TPA: lipid-binding SYLF domain-containing protein [Candidatus Cybelea sp.]|nr:lipid-binding SYLF domain-containing protein [Candidatus Cybelea sp.]
MHRLRPWLVILVFAAFISGSQGRAVAQTVSEQQILVDRARSTIEQFTAQSDMEQMRRILKKARAVVIFPQILKAGFIIGGEGGSGVLLAHDRQTGAWTAPSFYTLGSGSIGLQIGAEVAQVVLLIMTDKALNAVINNQVKLGADATIAVGPMGKGVEAATTTALNADIYSFAATQGLFAGLSLAGSVIKARNEWNRDYYGQPVTAGDIVIRRQVEAPAAAPLDQALTRAEL